MVEGIMRITRLHILIIVVILLLLFGILALAPLTTPKANEWAFKLTQIDRLHQLGFDGSEVVIGIIDTGLDSGHQEFDQESFIGWLDLIDSDSTFSDADGYGTHIAGLLVSEGSYAGIFSGLNLRGIAPKASLVIVKVIPQNLYLYGGGSDQDVAAGIQYCLDQQADILLLSLGMSPERVNFGDMTQTTQVLSRAIDDGVLVVVPAGNDGEDDDGDVCFPGSLESMISVGAISDAPALAPFSSRGHQYPDRVNPHKKPELVAPGVNIVSTQPFGAYAYLSGTSQAACYVTGILALLLDAYPQVKQNSTKGSNESTIILIKNILAQTALKIGSLQTADDIFAHDDQYGYGLIQAYDAYKSLGAFALEG